MPSPLWEVQSGRSQTSGLRFGSFPELVALGAIPSLVVEKWQWVRYGPSQSREVCWTAELQRIASPFSTRGPSSLPCDLRGLSQGALRNNQQGLSSSIMGLSEVVEKKRELLSVVSAPLPAQPPSPIECRSPGPSLPWAPILRMSVCSVLLSCQRQDSVMG